MAPCGIHLGKQLRQDAAVSGREAGESAPVRAGSPLRPLHVLLRRLPGKQNLFQTCSQAHWNAELVRHPWEGHDHPLWRHSHHWQGAGEPVTCSMLASLLFEDENLVPRSAA